MTLASGANPALLLPILSPDAPILGIFPVILENFQLPASSHLNLAYLLLQD